MRKLQICFVYGFCNADGALPFFQFHYLGINVAVHGNSEVLRVDILEILCPNADLN
jgi:hypothetical protein